MLSEAERACERDPLCKSFVEVEGMVYLKSCVMPDPIPKQGRTLYVQSRFYSGSQEHIPLPNPEKQFRTTKMFRTTSEQRRPPIFKWKTNHPSTTTTIATTFSDVPAKHQWRYDSSNLFAPPSECNWEDHEPPIRPTDSFQRLIQEVCAKYSDKACELFKFTLVDTWDRALNWIQEDDTAYVITGDIPLMWLRDSVAQVTPYLSIANDPSIQRLIEGLLRRAMVWIKMDPYGSSFRMELDFDHKGKKRLTDWDFECGRTVHVAMHDYEIDSLAYFVRLSYLYWKRTKRTCWMTIELEKTFKVIVDHWITEQDHETKSKYTYPTLKPNGRGSRVCRTGMTWGGMRPSDDAMQYHYNIPANMFASVTLTYMMEMSKSLGWNSAWLQRAEKLRDEIDTAVAQHGVFAGHYAYGLLFSS